MVITVITTTVMRPILTDRTSALTVICAVYCDFSIWIGSLSKCEHFSILMTPTKLI